MQYGLVESIVIAPAVKVLSQIEHFPFADIARNVIIQVLLKGLLKPLDAHDEVRVLLMQILQNFQLHKVMIIAGMLLANQDYACVIQLSQHL